MMSVVRKYIVKRGREKADFRVQAKLFNIARQKAFSAPARTFSNILKTFLHTLSSP